TVQDHNTLWKVIQASFNHTDPNLTEECWLCYSIKPPYYEAVAVQAKPRRINGTNPRECLWRQEPTTPGLTISQITRKGTCVG
ncbi:ENV2 protein, partial [Donacobius atricapilla]|nr:ENV2 protein [Donacobius atricapilla]